MTSSAMYLTSKTVLRLSGNATKFLQGLSANTLDQPRNAFVTIHGRIVATFDQIAQGEDDVLIAPETAFVEPLRRHIARYLPINQTRLQETDLKAYFDLTGAAAPAAGEAVIGQKTGRLLLTARAVTPTVSDGDFLRFRVEQGIPLQGVDYANEFLLNVSETEYVSFTKGCFLGQEPIAKVHNRSRPSWVLAVRYADEIDEDLRARMTSRITESGSGRERGFVFLPVRPPAGA